MTHQTFRELSEDELKRLEDEADLVAHSLALAAATEHMGLSALSPEARTIYRMQLWLGRLRQEATERRHAHERTTFAAAQEKFSTPLAAE